MLNKLLNSNYNNQKNPLHRRLLIQHITLLTNVRNHLDTHGLQAGIHYYSLVMKELKRWAEEELPEADLEASGYFKFTQIAPSNSLKTYRLRLNTTLGGLQGALETEF